MNFFFLLLSCLLWLGSAGNSLAQTGSSGTNTPSLSLPVPGQFLVKPLPELPGVVSWKTLAQVKVIKRGERLTPQFGPEVSALHNTQVKVQGYMLAIETGERHSRFLLSLNPPHCPFCMTAGAEAFIEVKMKNPIRFSHEPIILSGKLHALPDEPTDLYYRLTEAGLSGR